MSAGLAASLFVFGALLLITPFAIYFAHRKRLPRSNRVIRELSSEARRLGLKFSSIDPFDMTSLPLAPLSEGTKQQASDVMWGTWQGVDVKVFDYRWYQPGENRGGTWWRYTCALTGIGASCPGVVIAGRKDHEPGAHPLGTLTFESAEFNKEWAVQGQDAEFATALVDQRMIEWLMGPGRGLRYAVEGPYVLVYERQIHPDQVEPMLSALRGFHAHIPTVVSSLAPKDPAAAGPAAGLRSSPSVWHPRTTAPIVAVLGAVLSLVVGILKITLPAPGTPPPNPQASFRGFQSLTLPRLQARLTEFDPSVADRDWYRHITGVRGTFGSITLSTNLRQTAGGKKVANTECFNVWSTLIGDFTNVFVVVDDKGGSALATCSINTVG